MVLSRHLDEDGKTILMTREEYEHLPRLEKLAATLELKRGTARIVEEERECPA